MSETEIIGVDVGYGQTKIVSRNGIRIFSSLVGPAKQLIYKLEKNKEDVGETVIINEKKYFVGQRAELCDSTFSLLTRGWIKSDIYVALFASGLLRAKVYGEASSKLCVVTGLPVDYMADKVKVEEQIMIASAAAGVTLSALEIVPQPFGTFFDHCLDTDGDPKLTRKIRLFGVVDIGRHTTDFILIRDLKHNLERASGSITTGVASIVDGVRRDVIRELGRDNVMASEIEECICRTGTINIDGKNQNVSEIVNAHITNAAQSIAGVIQSRWAPEGEPDLVLMSGGGSILLKSHMKDIAPYWQLKEDAQIANARGYFKHGLFLQKVNEK